MKMGILKSQSPILLSRHFSTFRRVEGRTKIRVNYVPGRVSLVDVDLRFGHEPKREKLLKNISRWRFAYSQSSRYVFNAFLAGGKGKQNRGAGRGQESKTIRLAIPSSWAVKVSRPFNIATPCASRTNCLMIRVGSSGAGIAACDGSNRSGRSTCVRPMARRSASTENSDFIESGIRGTVVEAPARSLHAAIASAPRNASSLFALLRA